IYDGVRSAIGNWPADDDLPKRGSDFAGCLGNLEAVTYSMMRPVMTTNVVNQQSARNEGWWQFWRKIFSAKAHFKVLYEDFYTASRAATPGTNELDMGEFEVEMTAHWKTTTGPLPTYNQKKELAKIANSHPNMPVPEWCSGMAFPADVATSTWLEEAVRY